MKNHQSLYNSYLKTVEYSERAMGSTFSYRCFPNSLYTREESHHLFVMAHSEVLRVQNKFTEFKKSCLTKINEDAGKRWTFLDDESYFLLKKAMSFSKHSQGLFSLSMSSLSLPWKLAAKNGKFLTLNERKKYLKFVNDELIQFDDRRKAIFLPFDSMKIGLGGLGKGYAVDRAFEYLKSEGLVNFCVNGGGDLRVHSISDAPRPWKIGITNPFSLKQKFAGWIQLKNEAVSTSGSYRQQNSNEDHHIIHPRTGFSEKIIKSATIISGSTMESDAHCTIIMNMKWNEAINWMQKNSLRGVLIHANGQTYSRQ